MSDDVGLDEYQDAAEDTAKGFAEPHGVKIAEGDMSDHEERAMFLALGLTGEAGEAAEKVKKYVREGDDVYLDELHKELGDVLWYWSMLARLIDADASDVAHKNMAKLQDRYKRDVLFGQGDDR